MSSNPPGPETALVLDVDGSDQLVPARIRSSIMQGRDGGVPFDDCHPTRRVVTEIRLRANTHLIVAIQVVYEGSGTAPQHGEAGGDTSSFYLDEGEKIVRIDGRAARFIDQLQFFTNTGRSSAIYGGYGGTAFRWSVPEGYHFRYFTGRSACLIDSLQAHFEEGSSAQLVPVKVRSSTVQGGHGGLPFDDYHPTRGVVREIRVRATDEIVAIQVVYEGSGTAPQHGGAGGNTSSFYLDEGEKIVRIDGRAAGVINQLQFFTSNGRSSVIYGGGVVVTCIK